MILFCSWWYNYYRWGNCCCHWLFCCCWWGNCNVDAVTVFVADDAVVNGTIFDVDYAYVVVDIDTIVVVHECIVVNIDAIVVDSVVYNAVVWY